MRVLPFQTLAVVGLSILLAPLRAGAQATSPSFPSEQSASVPDSAAFPAARREVYALGRFGTYRYERPRLLAPFRDMPGDMGYYGRQLWSRQAATVALSVTAITLLVLPFDQNLHHETSELAADVRLDHSSAQRTLCDFRAGPFDFALRYPATINSAIYWLGEGSPSLLTAGAFWVTGRIRRDNRALSTAAQLSENAIATGIATQLLKRVAGRQTPRLATKPGGQWVWLPNWKTYQHHVPNYDSYPSGHLTTLSATFTTLAENYPEYRAVIFPIGGAAIVGCGFAMVNTGVHWTSDYPLALALGWSYAHFTVRRHRTRLGGGMVTAAAQKAHPWRFPVVAPVILTSGVAGVRMGWNL